MANLAIRGHATRGNEVIKIFEMLGGINYHKYTCKSTSEVYSINQYGNIDVCVPGSNSYFILFTLEGFLEKYPYKVNDKVQYKNDTSYNTMYIIERMNWINNHIEYEIRPLHDYNCTGLVIVCVDDLQPYKEEVVEKRQYEELRMPLDDDDKLTTEATIDDNKITPPENYLIGKITKVDNGMLVEFVKKQPQYPKTYEECCKILGICSGETLQYGGLSIAYDYEFSLCMLLENLRKLLICRDAYWKIAGENMGLGKPWEPDWLNTEQDKFVLYTHDDAICLNCFVLCHNVLAFPTAEMRDAFLENFKELIELVKERL